MTKPLTSLAAAGLALAPAAAWARGDHHGERGLLHVLTSFDHFGAVLLAGLAVGLVARRLRPIFADLARRATERDGST